ncbi:MAG: hypothetical protein M1833_000338 [Piccolia ochrophora]|nr:MAG: hypothetical protein M1833_000338 [Piccolia ochrophora]
MPRMRKKRVAANDDDNSDGGVAAGSPASKRMKLAGSSSHLEQSTQTDDNGSDYWEVGPQNNLLKQPLSEFKGKIYISIREYYEKDGKSLPGKKGISLPIDQYGAFVASLPQIEVSLKAKGEVVPRPEYTTPQSDGGGAPNENDVENEVERQVSNEGIKEEPVSTKKKNFEETSDEED